MKRCLKPILFCVMAILIGMALVMTGCSSQKVTMFSKMREAQQVKAGEFKLACDITVKDGETETPIYVEVNGKISDTKSVLGASIKADGITYGVDELMRVNEEGIYFNYMGLMRAMGMDTYLSDDTPEWLKMDPVTVTDEAESLSDTLSGSILDAFELACSDMNITEDNGTYTLTLTKDNLPKFISNVLEQINQNISSWYDSYVELLEKEGADSLLQQYAQLYGASDDEDEFSVEQLKSNKEQNIQAIQDAISEIKDALESNTSEASSEAVSEASNEVASEASNEAASEASNEAASEASNEAASEASSEASTEEGTSDDGENAEEVLKDMNDLNIAYSIKVDGNAGSREVQQGITLDCTSDDGSIQMNLQYTMTEMDESDITVDSPDADSCQDFNEYMENMSNMYSDLYSDDDEEDAGENPLTSDEITAAQKLIKDGQIYLIDAEKEVTPVIISYDKSTWSAEDTVCQAYATLTANSGSEMDIQYEQGDASAAKEQIETSLTAYQSFFAGDGVTISDMKDFTCGGYTGQYFTTVYDMDDEKQSLVIATISVEDGYLMVTYMEDGKALTDKELEKVASSLFEKIAPVQKEV